MSERDHPLEPDGERAGPPLRPTKIRLSIEFALLFAVALLLKQFLGGTSGAPYPNPLWLPVIVLSLEHGLAAGLAATIIAIALQFSTGLPPMLLTDDMYSYIGRIAAEPISWACVALLIGHIRSQQIGQVERLEGGTGGTQRPVRGGRRPVRRSARPERASGAAHRRQCPFVQCRYRGGDTRAE